MTDVFKPEGQTSSDNFSLSANQNLEKSSVSQSLWGNISEDNKSYLDKKGFHSPDDLLKSYRELEKAYSSKISLPKDDNEESLTKFYSRLGMPDDISGFELKLSKEDEALADDFKKACLSAHILPKSAQAIYDWFSDYRVKENEKSVQQWNDLSAAEFDDQKKSWGAKAAFNLEQMKRGIRLFAGDDEEAVYHLEQALGTKRLMQIFARLGEAVSEDNPIGFGDNLKQKKGFDAEAFYREMFNDY